MDATTLRGIAQAVTPIGTSGTNTADAATNGSSSAQPTAGAGPVAAPGQPTLLGLALLTPPDGVAKTIQLPDGSMLVPIAHVTPGTGSVNVPGGGTVKIADVAAGTAAAPAPTTTTPAAPKPVTAGTPVTENKIDVLTEADQASDEGESKGFYYHEHYYAKYHDGGSIDLNDLTHVQRRMAKSTMAYLEDEEPDVKAFGINDIDVRKVDPAKDSELLTVNPRSHYYAEVHGVDGEGRSKTIPLVMNEDGAVFVDPRTHGGR